MLTLASPAKINLFLKILHKRPDGYHDLASLFQTISLSDTLHIKIGTKDLLSCSDLSLPTDHNNLVIKAIELFRKNTGIDTKFTVHLEKSIPHQAGLGGGSSNAATTLWACNQLTDANVSDKQLAEWGGQIGSDVPFFLSHGTAYCTGRGEFVKDLPPLDKLDMTIVKPNQGLSTPQVFGRLNLTLLKPRDPEEVLKHFLEGKPEYFNDLETPAFEAMPELASIKANLLQKGFETVLLSGSGSSLFCLGKGTAPVGAFKTTTVHRQPGTWNWI